MKRALAYECLKAQHKKIWSGPLKFLHVIFLITEGVFSYDYNCHIIMN